MSLARVHFESGSASGNPRYSCQQASPSICLDDSQLNLICSRRGSLFILETSNGLSATRSENVADESDLGEANGHHAM